MSGADGHIRRIDSSSVDIRCNVVERSAETGDVDSAPLGVMAERSEGDVIRVTDEKGNETTDANEVPDAIEKLYKKVDRDVARQNARPTELAQPQRLSLTKEEEETPPAARRTAFDDHPEFGGSE